MASSGSKEPKGERSTKREEPTESAHAPVAAKPPRVLVAARNFAIWGGNGLTPYKQGDSIETDDATAANLVRDGQAEWK